LAAVEGGHDAIRPQRSPSQGRSRTGTVLRYAGMPAGLLLASLVLYVWLSGKPLDSIEHQVLSADAIRAAVVQHLKLVVYSTVTIAALAVPLGVLLTRPFANWATPPVLALANIGQTVPSLGVLVVLALLWSVGFESALIALMLYAFLPVLRNTMVGLEQVDPAIKEAARGQGMTKFAVLVKIELPLAVPVILAGIRTALVINVGTATIAVLTNAGGLGAIVYSGIIHARVTVLIAGSVMTALLAMAVDYVAGVIEEWLSPRGL